jgi:sarcosine oxidase gamma subunit
VILYRPDEETFQLFVRPSFAGYLQGWLEDAISTV